MSSELLMCIRYHAILYVASYLTLTATIGGDRGLKKLSNFSQCTQVAKTQTCKLTCGSLTQNSPVC